jgi:hypothetical protein
LSGAPVPDGRASTWFVARCPDKSVVLTLEAASEDQAACRLLFLLKELHQDCWCSLELAGCRDDEEAPAAYADNAFPADIEETYDRFW